MCAWFFSFVCLFGRYCAWSMWLWGEMHFFFFPSLKAKNLSLSFLGCTENTAQPDGFPCFPSPSGFSPAPLSSPLALPPSHSHAQVRVSFGSPGPPAPSPVRGHHPPSLPVCRASAGAGCSGVAVTGGEEEIEPFLVSPIIGNSRLHTFFKKK